MGSVRTSRGRCFLYFTIALLSTLLASTGHAQWGSGAAPGSDFTLGPTSAAGFTPSSFQVTDTGAATYTIPIQVPPGTAGLEPKLALTYNSQGGNGHLGVGWGLSGLSVIYRCGKTIAQDVLNGGVNYDNNDRYCIDGQRLVMISASGTYGGDGVEYRTERESFMRIISFGPSVGSGPAYFRVWTKSGQIIEYGNTGDSRIEAQGKADVRTYAVNKISDTKGNYLTVTYAEDNLNGDYRPTRIDYTGNVAASTPTYASVQFSYEDRTDINPIFVGGSVINIQKRLTSVKTYVGATPIRDYRVAYIYSPNGDSPLSKPSLVTSITECTGDGTSCLPAHSPNWNFGTGDGKLSDPTNWGVPVSPLTPPLLGDIDGDGLADLVYTSAAFGSPSIIVHFSNGNGFGGPVVVGSADYTTDPDSGGITVTPIALGDVDGDCLTDVVTVGNPGFSPAAIGLVSAGAGNVRLSTGRGSLAPPVNWGSPVLSPDGTRAALADIDGDGLADMVYLSSGFTNGNVIAHFSHRNGFDGPVAIGSSDFMADPDSGNVSFFPIVLGDVNGDGRADVVGTGSPVSVRLSTGRSLTAPLNWGGFIFFPSTLPMIADVNGDGLADLVYVSGGAPGGPSVMANLSNGGGFSGPAIVGPADSLTFNGQDADGGQTSVTVVSPIIAADVNGDGRADIVTSGDGSSAGFGNARLGQARSPDTINKFTNSLGAFVEIAYGHLTDSTVYTKATGAQCPVRDVPAQNPMQLVSSINQSDGIGGKYTTTYKYTGAKVHTKGGGFLGFSSVASNNTPEPSTTVTTTKTFRQDYPFQNLVTQSSTTLGSGALLTQVNNNWNTFLLTNSTGKYHRCDLASSEQITNDLDGTPLPTVTTTYSNPDAFGNVQDITVATKIGGVLDGHSKTTHNVYTNDTTNSNWFLGRLINSQVTSTIPPSALP
ncbi:MAG TPA: FG-GAP-like repeat-containing protein [Burkholderiales bacterium]|nr:FG-GAP-like repeat-containing protein [Burkholderiales bacterium]